jgi:hypothetical protein
VRGGYDRAPLPPSQKPEFQHVPIAAAAQRVKSTPPANTTNGVGPQQNPGTNGQVPQPQNGSNGNAPQPKQNGNGSDATDSGSSANHALAGTRNGRQALLELYAVRGQDPIGRDVPMQYMRSRVVHK